MKTDYFYSKNVFGQPLVQARMGAFPRSDFFRADDFQRTCNLAPRVKNLSVGFYYALWYALLNS